MKIIGLCGPARSGKNTIAHAISSDAEFMSETVVMSFAAPIKQMLRTMLEAPIKDHDKEATIDWLGRSPRYLMQTLGTQWGRSVVQPDLWIRMLERRIPRGVKWVVITDVRFENEADWVRRQGVLVHVSRDQQTAIGGADNHESEAGIALLPNDQLINNNGTLTDLRYAVAQLLANLVEAVRPLSGINH
jgi:hypothetical protein